jgi:hypothetical protein
MHEVLLSFSGRQLFQILVCQRQAIPNFRDSDRSDAVASVILEPVGGKVLELVHVHMNGFRRLQATSSRLIAALINFVITTIPSNRQTGLLQSRRQRMSTTPS